MSIWVLNHRHFSSAPSDEPHDELFASDNDDGDMEPAVFPALTAEAAADDADTEDWETSTEERMTQEEIDQSVRDARREFASILADNITDAELETDDGDDDELAGLDDDLRNALADVVSDDEEDWPPTQPLDTTTESAIPDALRQDEGLD